MEVTEAHISMKSYPKPKLIAGSEEWSKRIRKKAKVLARTIDTGFMELAEMIYTIYDTPVNGDPKNMPVWKSWGYTNFTEYAEQELGIGGRRAEHLKKIWYVLSSDDLKALDRSLRKRLIGVGWTKCRELVRVLTFQNAEKWIEMAENTNYPDLLANIAKALEVADQQAAVDGDDDGPDPVPPEGKEKVKGLTFQLVEAQYDNVQLALKRASEMSQSSSKNHNLDMICTDFLGTNDFKLANDPEMQLRYFAKFEKLFGVRLMVVDPKTRKMLYGMEALELIASDDV